MFEIPEDWYHALYEEFEREYFNELMLFLKACEIRKEELYPKKEDVFRALDLTPLDKVRVVILGFEPKEINEDLAKQGVLFLNSVLTMKKGSSGSHQNKGWEIFTDEILPDCFAPVHTIPG